MPACCCPLRGAACRAWEASGNEAGGWLCPAWGCHSANLRRKEEATAGFAVGKGAGIQAGSGEPTGPSTHPPIINRMARPRASGTQRPLQPGRREEANWGPSEGHWGQAPSPSRREGRSRLHHVRGLRAELRLQQRQDRDRARGFAPSRFWRFPVPSRCHLLSSSSSSSRSSCRLRLARVHTGSIFGLQRRTSLQSMQPGGSRHPVCVYPGGRPAFPGSQRCVPPQRCTPALLWP